MASVDEILASPLTAIELPPGAIPLHAVVIVEYAEPGSDNAPGRNRLGVISDDEMPPWSCIGMLRFAAELELDTVRRVDDLDDD